MDRGVKDEAFVRRALELADNETGRWIANQSSFNHPDATPLQPKVKAAIVTAVSIYVEKANFEESEVEHALAINTVGEARALVDRLSQFVPKP